MMSVGMVFFLWHIIGPLMRKLQIYITEFNDYLIFDGLALLKGSSNKALSRTFFHTYKSAYICRSDVSSWRPLLGDEVVQAAQGLTV